MCRTCNVRPYGFAVNEGLSIPRRERDGIRCPARLKKNSFVMRICSLEARGCRGVAGRPGSCTGAGQGKHDVSRAAVSDDCEVAVIGAGPYGLAVAAHLRSAGVALAHRRWARPAGFSQAGASFGSRRISHPDLGMGPAE